MKRKLKDQPSTAPGEGERRAQRGYQEQYATSAALIYGSLLANELVWLGLADRQADILDDLVLGLKGKVVGHQFKSAEYPCPFTVRTLMLGADKMLASLVNSWRILCAQFPGAEVEVRFVTSDFPSTRDEPVKGMTAPNHSAAFLAELRDNSDRPLSEWLSSRWSPFIEELQRESGLEQAEFEKFMRSLRVESGHDAALLKGMRSGDRNIREIARMLPELIGRKNGRDRWSREELLAELKWSDAIGRRRSHQFPVGAFVQRNVATEQRLLAAIGSVKQGYVSLLGPPGAGKSTLLQTSLQATDEYVVIRYFAFLPDERHGLGRAEAEEFLLDVTGELWRSGLQGLRLNDNDIREMRQQFEHLLKEAGARFVERGVATVIVVDGLDHIPREEKPERSLLCELPLPASIPRGVVFVLGSQHLDLQGLSPAVRDEASAPARSVPVEPLSREAVYCFADEAGLDQEIDRETIHKLTQGHPLATRYLIEALKAAPSGEVRDDILNERFDYQGDIKRVYDAAWRDIEGDTELRRVLAYVARAEGPLDPELIATIVDRGAVERAYQATKHLLDTQSGRWRIFHNSFRLYLLGKEERPLGKKDSEYGRRLYNDLAVLTSKAAPDDPQRWLELRYKARAGESANVVALATPERFRTQLAEGRPAHDIHTDIRLAFQSAGATRDLAQLVRLLLSRHEILRRAETLRYAESIVDAYLALGDLDAARGLVGEGISGSKAYEIVDAFVLAGRIEEARRLFDELEPLASAPTHQMRYHELAPWAERVHQFRQGDQIAGALARLLKPIRDNEYEQREAEEADRRLRFDIARAVVSDAPDTNVDDVIKQLEIEPGAWPHLRLSAALAALSKNKTEIAAAHLKAVLGTPEEAKLARGWRRHAAIHAFRLGDTSNAKRLFPEIEAPSMADAEQSTGSGPVQSLARAIIEHAALAAALGEAAPQGKPSQYQVFTSFQSHLMTLGRFLGVAKRGQGSTAPGLVACCTDLLTFLNHVQPDGADTSYRVSLVRASAGVAIKAMIQAAVLHGKQTYAAVVEKITEETSRNGGNLRGSLALRQELSTTMFDYDGDAAAAAARLERAYADLGEARTPSEHVNEIAGFARAFAYIGDEKRARQLMASIHRETLGYFLAPKKDPQYIFWRSVFERACEADPGNRTARVKFMTRLLAGMESTEGYAAAHRLTASVVEQASLSGPAIGAAVANVLEEHGLVSWDGLVDSLLRGLVRRRPDLTRAAAHAWGRLVLPYYDEPYYQDDRLGGFTVQVISSSSSRDAEAVAELLRSSIEAESVQEVRPALLGVLLKAVRDKGLTATGIERALERWSGERRAKRDSSGETPDAFAAARSLSELSQLLVEANGKTHYRTVDHVNRLIEASSFEEAESFADQHPSFLDDGRVRFALARAAVAAGKHGRARELLNEYKPERERQYWDPWYGGAKLELHRLLVALDGEAGREVAFKQFAEDLSRGRENIVSLLPDLPDVIDVMSAKPDWPAIWQSLQGQLSGFRDYRLGDDLDIREDMLPKSEEDLLAFIYQKAFSLRLAELSRQARVGAALGCDTAEGIEVLCRLIDRLLGGEGDEPLEAMGLLYKTRRAPQIAARFGAQLGDLVEHADFAVSIIAGRLAVEWGIPIEKRQHALPSFYSLVFDNEEQGTEYRSPGRIGGKPETIWINDPLDWTWPMRFQMGMVSEATDISHTHLRQRCAQVINAQGGIEKFGPASQKLIEGRARRLEMRLTFWRPVMAAAMQALRRVVGELMHAGHVDPRAMPFLLHELGFPGIGEPFLTPSPRPTGIRRSNMDDLGFGLKDEDWLNKVADDLRPTDTGDDVLLAEVTVFEHRSMHKTATATRIVRHEAQVVGCDDPEDALRAFPSALGLEERNPTYREPAGSFVATIRPAGVNTIPEDLLAVCPHWAKRLGWSPHPENPLVYRDESGTVMARTIWWRDGGPRDAHEDVWRGEGCLVLLTATGASRLKAMGGALQLRKWCWRRTGAEVKGGAQQVRRASRP